MTTEPNPSTLEAIVSPAAPEGQIPGPWGCSAAEPVPVPGLELVAGSRWQREWTDHITAGARAMARRG